MLYVSHDRYFINRTATRILELSGQTFLNYIGNYDYYLEKRELMNSLNAGEGDQTDRPAGSPVAARQAVSAQSEGKQDWRSRKEEQAKLRKKQNELKKTEDKIASLEARDSELDEQLMRPEVASDAGELLKIHREKEAVRQQLEQLYEVWENLAQDV